LYFVCPRNLVSKWSDVHVYGGPTITGVDFTKILGETKYWGTKGGNNRWQHRRFSIIGVTCPGCPQSLRLCL